MTTSRMIFPNLAVDDVTATQDFWGALGFTFNPQFTDEHAASMRVNDQAYVMFLDKARFAEFTTKQLADTGNATEAIIALSAESRVEVDHLVDTALANGAKPSKEPMDMGFMYGRSFQDPDGHLWEVMWMDPAAIQQQPEA